MAYDDDAPALRPQIANDHAECDSQCDLNEALSSRLSEPHRAGVMAVIDAGARRVQAGPVGASVGGVARLPLHTERIGGLS